MRWVVMIGLLIMPVTAWATEQPPAPEPGAADVEKAELERHAEEVGKWREAVRNEVAEMKAQAEKAPEQVSAALKKCMELKEKLAAKLDEQVAAIRAAAWEKVDALAKELGGFEKEVAMAQIDLEEAHVTYEMTERARTEGVPEDKVSELVAQIKDTFAVARNLHKQMMAIQQEQEKLEQRRQLIHKRLEMLVLEAQAAKLEKEVGAAE